MNFNPDVLAKFNYKDLTGKNFHRFLNKSVTITAEERGTDDIFPPVGIEVGYAWNSTPIDGTNIIRIILAIDRGFHFSLDASLNTLPKLTQNNSQAALYYLKLTNSSRYFPISILKKLFKIVKLLTPSVLIIIIIIIILLF